MNKRRIALKSLPRDVSELAAPMRPFQLTWLSLQLESNYSAIAPLKAE